MRSAPPFFWTPSEAVPHHGAPLDERPVSASRSRRVSRGRTPSPGQRRGVRGTGARAALSHGVPLHRGRKRRRDHAAPQPRVSRRDRPEAARAARRADDRHASRAARRAARLPHPPHPGRLPAPVPSRWRDRGRARRGSCAHHLHSQHGGEHLDRGHRPGGRGAAVVPALRAERSRRHARADPSGRGRGLPRALHHGGHAGAGPARPREADRFRAPRGPDLPEPGRGSLHRREAPRPARHLQPVPARGHDVGNGGLDPFGHPAPDRAQGDPRGRGRAARGRARSVRGRGLQPRRAQPRHGARLDRGAAGRGGSRRGPDPGAVRRWHSGRAP